GRYAAQLPALGTPVVYSTRSTLLPDSETSNRSLPPTSFQWTSKSPRLGGTSVVSAGYTISAARDGSSVAASNQPGASAGTPLDTRTSCKFTVPLEVGRAA